MATLEARSLTLSYDAAKVVEDLTLELPAGEVTMIVGANGCGKSTLLRGLARLLKPAGGSVLLDGRDIRESPARDVARVLGLLPQAPVAPDGISVRELVGRGRYPHQGWFRRWSADDDAAVDRALHATGTGDLAERPVDELSGGQRQRAWIAMALAQETDLLLLDEPTTFLDVAHQLEVLDVVADLNRRRGTTVAIVLHDLNLAARYADHLVALKDGRIVAQGRPADVVTEEMVQDVFGMPCRVIPDPVAGTPLVLPIGRNRVVRRKTARPPLVEPAGAEWVEPVETAWVEPVETAPVAPPSVEPVETAPVAPPSVEPVETAPVETPDRPSLEVCSTLAYALTAVAVQDLGPSFRRITFTGADLAHFGTGGHPLDLRIKMIIPPHADADVHPGTADHFAGLRPGGTVSDEDATGWYRRWLSIDASERGAMRTYSVRSFRPAGHPGNVGPAPELDVDFVLHVRRENGRLVGGPASVWAAEASAGDRLTMLGPNRNLCGPDYGGVEFRPGAARRILLAGDETAAPAICSILESLPPGITGNAYIEVPGVDDIQGSFTRSGVTVQWLPRDSRPHGELLGAAVRSAVAIPAAGAVDTGADPEDVDVDSTILWETTSVATQPFYAWLAGEAGTIKELRRYLVRDAGIDRKQVAFMGYWRRGKAEL
ncbi:MAG: SIP domain-containing protein [Arthrobacter sp.]|uniref:SIP domain-containing protein n=1 Tax=Arthrobacter sp. TaxID=1667 RepID=UPI00348B6339